ncbi:MAG TPA: helix-hairpin-helix domain-containing protein [Bacillales bacterium]|nr:helix-hairpin-helix domain-containing protein [Bacillales bacterium]
MNRFNWSKREVILGGCAAVFLLLLVVNYFHSFSKPADSHELAWKQAAAKQVKPEVKKPEKPEPKTIVIDVKGAVKMPGVYKMEEGDRIVDAIQKAGGFLKKADRRQINLARLLQDQMEIIVPKKGEKGVAPAGSGTAVQANGSGKVAINSASESELEKIPGVGPVTAKAILEYRKKHGPFQEIKDLLKVSGIGEKTLDGIKDKITL